MRHYEKVFFPAYKKCRHSAFLFAAIGIIPEWEPVKLQQFAIDRIFRFGNNEEVFIGSRYNTVTGVSLQILHPLK